jgi:hypothetical protein
MPKRKSNIKFVVTTIIIPSMSAVDMSTQNFNTRTGKNTFPVQTLEVGFSMMNQF